MPSPSTRQIRENKPSEKGFALLLIFLMAALIGISMYAVLPRVAFESERDREQLLVDRGNEYKRGIKLYFRKLHTYPAKLEDLENMNGVRFLRRRYKDPLNNSAEWRLIHVGPGGMFLDSLTQKNSSPNQSTASVNNSVTELKPIADGSTEPASDVNVALRRRPSDGAPGGEGSDPSSGLPPDPNNPLPPNGSPPSGTGSNPGDPNSGANPITAGSGGPNGSGLGNGGQGAPGGPPGFPPNGGSSTGADQIRRLLTTPNPNPGSFGSGGAVGILGAGSGQPGNSGFGPPAPAPGSSLNVSATGSGTAGSTSSFGTPIQGSTNGTTVGGGIAGVASKVKRSGIKIFNERKKINEWEFIYDYGKEAAAGSGIPPPANPNNPAGATPAGANPNPNSTPGPAGGIGSSPSPGTPPSPAQTPSQ